MAQPKEVQNAQSDPDKFVLLGVKLAKEASKSAKVVLISAKGQFRLMA